MKKKRSVKGMKAEADRLFSQLIRSKGRCEWCGSTLNLQCSHVVSRKYNSVRWDEDNAECLCARCHRRAHDFPAINGRRLERKMGAQAFDALHLRAQAVTKMKHQDWLDLLQALKDKLERLAA